MTDTRRPAVLLTMLLGFVLVPSNGVRAYCSVVYAPILEGLRKAGWKE